MLDLNFFFSGLLLSFFLILINRYFSSNSYYPFLDCCSVFFKFLNLSFSGLLLSFFLILINRYFSSNSYYPQPRLMVAKT